MRVNIELAKKKRKAAEYTDNEEKWAEIAEQAGFQFVPQSTVEPKGLTLRSFPTYDDIDMERAIQDPSVIQLKVYDIKAFRESTSENPVSPMRFDSLFFWDEEGTGYPPIVFKDIKGNRVAFADPNTKDIFIHNFGDKIINDRTAEMLQELLTLAAAELGVIAEPKEKSSKKKREKLPFLYGIDPEFIFFSPLENRTPSAEDVLDKFGYNDDTPIGYDGHGHTGELRTKAFPTPEGVIGNLKNLIRELYDFCQEKNLEVIAGGGAFRKPLGGHVHISPIVHDPNLITAFDIFIGGPLKSMVGGSRPDLSRDELCTLGSGGVVYGTLGHYEDQNYADGNRGVEYKTPPSFITLPSLALGVLKIAQIITERGYRKQEIPDYFSRESLMALARTRYERLILKKYLFYIKYGDLQSDLFENWLVKESCLQSRITIKDKTGKLNVRKLKRKLVREFREEIISRKTEKKIVIITEDRLWNEHYIKLKPVDALVRQIGRSL
jgi:hypothetical protein